MAAARDSRGPLGPVADSEVLVGWWLAPDPLC
jgi:hypothetical protein